MTVVKGKSLATGYPPWHASAFVAALLTLSAVFMPTTKTLDEMATVETFTTLVFPDVLSLRTVGILRCLVAFTIWAIALQMISSKGWVMYTNYKPYSRLKNSWLRLEGYKTLRPFTSWSWMILGAAFSLSGYISLKTALQPDHEFDPWTLRMALIAWELAAPFAILVSAVVTYAIWPIVLAGGKPHELGNFRNQMMHNFNSIIVLTELSLLGGLPVQLSHLALPCFVGNVYILFTWANCFSYSKPEDGPQYIYWFMDTTLGKVTTIALVCLLVTLLASFALFIGLESISRHIGGSIAAHVLFVPIISFLVIRTK